MRKVPPPFVFASFAIFLFFSACSLDKQENYADSREARPDAVFVGFSRDEIENGVVVFSARAERAEYFKDRGLLVVSHVVFEDRGSEGGEPKARGEADRAMYYEGSGDAEFSGHVRISSFAEDFSFETNALKYFSATQTLEGAPDDVVAVRVGQKLFVRGSGFFADIREKVFVFRNGVEGSLSREAASGSR